MKAIQLMRSAAVALASFGIVCPQLVQAGNSQAPAQAHQAAHPVSAVKDVALAEGGTFKGAVLNPQGHPVARTAVVVAKADQLIAQTHTDEDGRFAMSGLQGGVYQVATVSGVEIYRLWAPNTAPPAAGREALLMAGDTLVRGQQGAGVLRFLGSPWVLAAIVATAIAVPLAMEDDDAS